MDWSPQQQRALDEVGKWLASGSDQQVYRLFGYAGTGKTTLAKHLSESAGAVQFAAYTGKAAHVLKTKGCANATTLHSLIYQPRDAGENRIREIQDEIAEVTAELEQECLDLSPEERQAVVDKDPYIRRLKAELEEVKKAGRKPSWSLRIESPLRDIDLLVIDECSMVDDRMAEDIMSFGCKILVLGDPGQLPPVRGSGYFTEARPDMLLEEVHRQARDNPIIALATQIRKGLAVEPGEYGTSRVIFRQQADQSMYTSHNQVIVGRNKTRSGCNRRIREILGRDACPTPVAGDRVICLRNDKEMGLLNGSMWEVGAATAAFNGRLTADIKPLDDMGTPIDNLSMHEHYFLGEEPPFYEIREAASFDFGYAITGHKSQGSQWDRVLIVDESSCFRESAHRWLYTAVTRAAESVTIVI